MSFSMPFKSGFSLKRNSIASIDLPPVPVQPVETSVEKRARAVKHLLRLNHASYSILYHQLEFHNHCPHILGSAYALGGSKEHLNSIYETVTEELEEWKDSPGEISKHDWRDYLGKKEYQRAYVDFFEDRLIEYGYDWKRMVLDYMCEGREPLINALIDGVGHPLIHLAYGFEFASRDVAIEALAMTCCSYDKLHRYLDNPGYTRPVAQPSPSPMDILHRVALDRRFDGILTRQGADNIGVLLTEREDAVLEHWNAWKIEGSTSSSGIGGNGGNGGNAREAFAESQRAAAALLVATQRATDPRFDFFLVHTLTTSHAVRIMLPIIPARMQVSLIRQWWLFALVVYIAQLRPPIKQSRISNYALEGRYWGYVVDKALKSDAKNDTHFVKAIRALKEAAETWGDESDFFLKAAVRFATDFTSWGGFGELTAEDERVMDKYRKWAEKHNSEFITVRVQE